MAERRVTIRIEGDAKGAKAAIDETAAALKSLGAAGQESTALLQSQVGRMAQVFGSIREAAGGLGLAVVAGIGVSVKAFADFEFAMNKIGALAGVSREQIKSLGDELLHNAPEWGRKPKELAEALYFVVSAGFPAAQAMDVLRAAVHGSAAEHANLAIVTDGLTSLLKAYGISTKDSEKVTSAMTQAVIEGKLEFANLAGAIGRVAPIAAQLGVPLTDLLGSLTLITRTGLSADEAATALRSGLNNLNKPAKETQKVLSSVGLTVDDLQRAIVERGTLGAMQLLWEHSGRNAEMFGRLLPNIRGFNGAMTLIKSGADGEAVPALERIKQAYEGGAVGVEGFTRTSETLLQKMHQLAALFDVLRIKLGGVFSDEAKSAADGLLSMGRAAQTFVEQNPKWLESAAHIAGTVGAVLALAGGARALQAAIYLLGVSFGPMFIGLRSANTVLTGMLGPLGLFAAAILILNQAADANIPIISRLGQIWREMDGNWKMAVVTIGIVAIAFGPLNTVLIGLRASLLLAGGAIATFVANVAQLGVVGAALTALNPATLVLAALAAGFVALDIALRTFTGSGVIERAVDQLLKLFRVRMADKESDSLAALKRELSEIDAILAKGTIAAHQANLLKANAATELVAAAEQKWLMARAQWDNAVQNQSAAYREANKAVETGSALLKENADVLAGKVVTANRAVQGANKETEAAVKQNAQAWSDLESVIKQMGVNAPEDFLLRIVEMAKRVPPELRGNVQAVADLAQSYLDARHKAEQSAAAQVAAAQASVPPIAAAIGQIRQQFVDAQKDVEGLNTAIANLGKKTPPELAAISAAQSVYNLVSDETALKMAGLTREAALQHPAIRALVQSAYDMAVNTGKLPPGLSDTTEQLAALGYKAKDLKGVELPSALEAMVTSGGKILPAFAGAATAIGDRLNPSLKDAVALGFAYIDIAGNIVFRNQAAADAWNKMAPQIERARFITEQTTGVTQDNTQAVAANTAAVQTAAGAQQRLSAATDGTQSAFAGARDAMVDADTSIQGVGSAADTTAGKAADMGAKVAEGAKTAGDAVKTELVAKVEAGVTESNDKLKTVGQGMDGPFAIVGGMLGQALGGALPPPVAEAVAQSDQTLSTIGQAAGGPAYANGSAVGGQLMAGVAAGISANAPRANGAIAAAMTDIVRIASETAQVRSPSLVFMHIGLMLMAGLAAGIEGGHVVAETALDDVAETLQEFVEDASALFEQIDISGLLGLVSLSGDVRTAYTSLTETVREGAAAIKAYEAETKALERENKQLGERIAEMRDLQREQTAATRAAGEASDDATRALTEEQRARTREIEARREAAEAMKAEQEERQRLIEGLKKYETALLQVVAAEMRLSGVAEQVARTAGLHEDAIRRLTDAYGDGTKDAGVYGSALRDLQVMLLAVNRAAIPAATAIEAMNKAVSGGSREALLNTSQVSALDALLAQIEEIATSDSPARIAELLGRLDELGRVAGIPPAVITSLREMALEAQAAGNQIGSAGRAYVADLDRRIAASKALQEQLQRNIESLQSAKVVDEAYLAAQQAALKAEQERTTALEKERESLTGSNSLTSRATDLLAPYKDAKAAAAKADETYARALAAGVSAMNTMLPTIGELTAAIMALGVSLAGGEFMSQQQVFRGQLGLNRAEMERLGRELGLTDEQIRTFTTLQAAATARLADNTAAISNWESGIALGRQELEEINDQIENNIDLTDDQRRALADRARVLEVDIARWHEAVAAAHDQNTELERIPGATAAAASSTATAGAANATATGQVAALNSRLREQFDIYGDLGRQARGGGAYIAFELIEGWIEGLKERQGLLNEAMADVVTAAIQAAKDAGEIKSPSEVTKREIGMPMIEGIARGILAGGDSVKDALVSVIEGAMAAGASAVDALIAALQDQVNKSGQALAVAGIGLISPNKPVNLFDPMAQQGWNSGPGSNNEKDVIAKHTSIPKYDLGAITTRDHLAFVHANEAILPLSRPDRFWGLLGDLAAAGRVPRLAGVVGQAADASAGIPRPSFGASDRREVWDACSRGEESGASGRAGITVIQNFTPDRPENAAQRMRDAAAQAGVSFAVRKG